MLYSPGATKRSNLAVVGMLGAIVLAYIVAALGLVGTATMCLTAAFLACCVGALWCVSDRRALFAVGLVFALVVLSLGVPSDGWDARSIWLFHGRRIFFDTSIYSQLDGYAGWSQNDYPVIVPMLMSGLAQLVGYWNESFPKVAGTLLLLPPLLVIFSSFRSLWASALFLIPLVSLGGVYLINGYMDALVAVYAVATLIAASRVRQLGMSSFSKLDAAVYVLVTAVMVMLKNEAIIIAGAIFAATFCEALLAKREFSWRLLCSFILAVLPLALWKFAVANHHVVNDLANSNVTGQLLDRLPNAFYSIFILEDLLLRTWILLPLAALVWAVWKNGVASTTTISLLACSAYALVLYVVYMSTPHDVRWHLQTSATRTIMPVAMLLAYAAIRALDGSGQDKPSRHKTNMGEANVD